MNRDQHRRWSHVAAAAVGAAVALPAPALAATTVSFNAGVSNVDGHITTGAVRITDNSGVTDELVTSGSVTVGVTVTSGGKAARAIKADTGCTQTSATIVSCPPAQGLVANLGAGADVLNNRTDLFLDLHGGPGNDQMAGVFAPGDDFLLGDSGDDVLIGRGGDDTERGGDGNDRLGPPDPADAAAQDSGSDTLEGGDGFDTIDAADGFRDKVIDCGPPTSEIGEIATIDLHDPQPTGCEVVREGAKDQHPLVQVRRGSGRVRGERLAVRLSCPKAHPERRCAGKVKVVKGGRTVARGRYRIRKGHKRTIKLLLLRDVRGRAKVLTREPDAHGRPEKTQTLIRLRG